MHKFTLFIIAAFLIGASPVAAAITFDNAEQNGAFSTAEFTLSNYTLGSGENRILLMAIATESTANVNEAIFNSTALTQIADVDFEGNNSLILLYLLEEDLPEAGEYTAAVSLSATVTGTIQILTLIGAAQEEPEASETATETNPATISDTITTLTDGAWIVSAVMAGDPGAFTANDDATERLDGGSGSTMTAAMSTEEVASAGEQTVSWTHSDGNVNRMISIATSIAPFQEAADSFSFDGIILNGVRLN